MKCNCQHVPRFNPTPCALHPPEMWLCLLVRTSFKSILINCQHVIGMVNDESYLHMFQLNQVESLQPYWEEGYTWEGPRIQPYSGQIELLTDLLENFLTARKGATPERLLHSQQRWKELSTEVAVISQLKKQTRQSQLVRALVSYFVMKCIM